MHPVFGNALGGEVLIAVARGGEKQLREAIGQDAVDLLRHAPVARAQAGLHMGDPQSQLGGHERDGERGVDVAGDHHYLGVLAQENRLDLHHHLRGLLRVRAAARSEVHVRLGHAQILEEDVGHLRVVMLAGVDQHLPHALALAQLGEDGRHLHEIGPGADDVKDLHPAKRAHGRLPSQRALL